jgi:cytochrome P450
LTAALLAAEIDGDRLDDVEILGFLFLMIIAGNETTTKLLGNAVYWLWRNPEQRRLLREDPGLIPRWVEETLRYDGSTQALARTLVGDLELHGQRMRDGDRIVLLVGSANRDERVFPDPDRYDVLRDTNAMLSFGQGTHFCLGAALARLEGRSRSGMQRRFRDFAVDPTGITRVHSVNVRGFAALPITFTRHAGERMSGTRTAVVTGASAGIGAAIARALGALGWSVALGARRTGLLAEVASGVGRPAGARSRTRST